MFVCCQARPECCQAKSECCKFQSECCKAQPGCCQARPGCYQAQPGWCQAQPGYCQAQPKCWQAHPKPVDNESRCVVYDTGFPNGVSSILIKYQCARLAQCSELIMYHMTSNSPDPFAIWNKEDSVNPQLFTKSPHFRPFINLEESFRLEFCKLQQTSSKYNSYSLSVVTSA